jgi:hypothetical protein
MGISAPLLSFFFVLFRSANSFSHCYVKNGRSRLINRIQRISPLSVSKQHVDPIKKRNKPAGNGQKSAKLKNHSKSTESWRIFGVTVHPDDLVDIDAVTYLAPPVIVSLCRRLKIDEPAGANALPTELSHVRVVRRSLDARKSKASDGPRFTYVLDVVLKAGSRLKIKSQPGRQELLEISNADDDPIPDAADSGDDAALNQKKPTVIIVGAGPAGLFCALTLAQSGKVKPILLERGQAVESRGKDIGGLMRRSFLNRESNFCFGEGGAGTFSDGKLTTRIGRNSESVRYVLETLVQFGAPSSILLDGAPHLGTDNLVRLMRNMRQSLRARGGQVHFGAKVDKLLHENGAAKGVEVSVQSSN